MSQAWLPILSPRGFDLFNDYHRFLLVDGPRRCGKTIACMHKLVRHAWETPGTKIGIFAKTLRNAKAGVWTDDLLGFVVPQWEAGNFGFRITKEPTTTADTKMSYFRVTNCQGGETEIQLHSAENASEIDMKFKSTRFGMVYISEADQFPDRKIFNTLSDQLRMIGVPYEKHQIMMDCNPPETGDEHWLHDVFFKDEDGRKKEDPGWADLFGRCNFVIDDNPFLDPREIVELKAKYSYDKVLYDRYINGLWTKDTGVGHFRDVFRPNIHILGGPDPGNPRGGTVLLPAPGTAELFSGWDLGDVNHAFVIASKREADDELNSWDIIDEIVCIKSRATVNEFVEAVIERMDLWEQFLVDNGYTKRVHWRHWSDSSALQFNSGTGSNTALDVRKLTNGRIVLNTVMKRGGSVRARVRLLKRLLNEDRIVFSAQLKYCEKMLRELRQSSNKIEIVPDDDQNKHVFDALTYMLSNESPLDAVDSMRRNRPQVGRRPVFVAS